MWVLVLFKIKKGGKTKSQRDLWCYPIMVVHKSFTDLLSCTPASRFLFTPLTLSIIAISACSRWFCVRSSIEIDLLFGLNCGMIWKILTLINNLPKLALKEIKTNVS